VERTTEIGSVSVKMISQNRLIRAVDMRGTSVFDRGIRGIAGLASVPEALIDRSDKENQDAMSARGSGVQLT
jgi:hypothetical protein